ncbi:MAG: hypothetical protein WA210_20895 [Burkholderiaceae bacterium]
MNSNQVLCGVLLAVFFAALPIGSSAQTAARTQAQNSLVGSWLVTVQGEAATRTLIVTEEAPTSDGTLLAAKYGMSNQGQGPIEAKMLRVGDQRQLVLVTQAGTRISATENPEGNFQGTFTLKSGGVKDLTIVRISEEARLQLLQAGTSLSIRKPGPDVPVACAAFIGSWTGDWGFGKRWFWVTEIDAKCIAKYSYGPQKPNGFRSMEIKDGKISFTCGNSGGTCSFTSHGDELWASYGGTDGSNNTVFQKVTDGNK